MMLQFIKEGVDDVNLAVTLSHAVETICTKRIGPGIAIPMMSTLCGISDIGEIDALTNGSSSYKQRNFIPVVPFLVKSINEAIMKTTGQQKKY